MHALDESTPFFCNLLPIKASYYLFILIRFFETEGIAALAMLVSQYKITIPEEPQFAGETFEEKKSRILSARQVLTLTYVIFIFIFISRVDKKMIYLILFFLLTRPVHIPLTLTRR